MREKCVCGAPIHGTECRLRAHLRGPMTVAQEIEYNRKRGGELRASPCPCGASAGGDCLDDTGAPVPWVHAGRVPGFRP